MNPDRAIHDVSRKSILIVVAVFCMLACLPLSVWLDVTLLSQKAAARQAQDLSSVISSIRSYYANNVVDRVLDAHSSGVGATAISHQYASIPGAIPLPATLSLELGDVISQQQGNIAYRFVSDFTFTNRPPHHLDKFERDALSRLRSDPNVVVSEASLEGFTSTLRLVTPVIMGQACVNCHDSHPESPKRDWKIGDVRGIQEIIVKQPFARNIFAFKFLLAYFVFVSGVGGAFIALQKKQAGLIKKVNADLETANQFLAGVSQKISRYLSPQIYKTIFSGKNDVLIQTERKRLTIFFSDIKDFTSTTERMQPEPLTRMLNEYLTEMSSIAIRHGGTVDKFIGDAVLVFFGDPESKGAVEDARACLKMAVEMQERLVSLRHKWRQEGVEEPFEVRMGINTGYCNVGNFGSEEKMDYTIIGAEANLAARLQSVAAPGKIVLSFETYALVKGLVVARALEPIAMKGISREVIPYEVESLISSHSETFIRQADGVDITLDLAQLSAEEKERISIALRETLKALSSV